MQSPDITMTADGRVFAGSRDAGVQALKELIAIYKAEFGESVAPSIFAQTVTVSISCPNAPPHQPPLPELQQSERTQGWIMP